MNATVAVLVSINLLIFVYDVIMLTTIAVS